jgi:hypothetical protein
MLAMVVTWNASATAAGWSGELLQAYYAAITNHFKVTPEAISDLRDQGVAVEDLPVVLLLAERAKVEPDQIGIVRASGASWMSIAEDHGLGADTFYILLGVKFSSNTYSPILDKYRSKPQKQWRGMQLTDAEIVNLVNLKFIASYHDYSMLEVMAMRDYGKTFPRINDQVAVAKEKDLARRRAERKKIMKAGI